MLFPPPNCPKTLTYFCVGGQYFTKAPLIRPLPVALFLRDNSQHYKHYIYVRPYKYCCDRLGFCFVLRAEHFVLGNRWHRDGVWHLLCKGGKTREHWTLNGGEYPPKGGFCKGPSVQIPTFVLLRFPRSDISYPILLSSPSPGN